MSIEWIPVERRLPDDRRTVLAWGYRWSLSTTRFLGETRFNPTRYGGRFDLEHSIGIVSGAHVTHWAEVTGPEPERSRGGPGQPMPG